MKRKAFSASIDQPYTKRIKRVVVGLVDIPREVIEIIVGFLGDSAMGALSYTSKLYAQIVSEFDGTPFVEAERIYVDALRNGYINVAKWIMEQHNCRQCYGRLRHLLLVLPTGNVELLELVWRVGSKSHLAEFFRILFGKTAGEEWCSHNFVQRSKMQSVVQRNLSDGFWTISNTKLQTNVVSWFLSEGICFDCSGDSDHSSEFLHIPGICFDCNGDSDHSSEFLHIPLA